MPWYLLLPLGSAAVYAFSSLLMKRGLRDGATVTQSFHVSNVFVSLIFAPLLLFEHGEVRWDLIHQPLVVSVAFFLGTWLTFLAIRKGDVSLVTPLMGTKVVFVAIGMALLARQIPPLALWIAAALTAMGVFLMGAGDFGKQVHGHATSVSAALLSAAVFGFCDVFVRMWSHTFGAMTFLALSSLGIGAISAIVWLIQGCPSMRMVPGAGRFIIFASILVGLQAVAVGLALSYFNDATGINVAYASRGLWAILLVSLVGPMLGNHERHASGRAFAWRIAGTTLLTAAVVLAVMARREG
ncbi:MAG: DMT family transporter [Verrucomicrobiae bacterium]|nr:DMT family transporter [Verrucomicrobiae bacterium]